MNASHEELSQHNRDAKPGLDIAAAEEDNAACIEPASEKTATSDSDSRSDTSESSTSLTGRVTALDRWLIERIFDFIGRPPVTLVLWDGQVAYGADLHQVPFVTLCDRNVLWRLLIYPELYYGDMYSAGRKRFEGDLA